jgi:uncharacterized protein involved in exopolysaccharide biosynthesis
VDTTIENILAEARKHILLVASLFVLSIFATIALYFLSTPTYEADAYVVADLGRPLAIENEASGSAVLRQDEFLNTEARIAMSRGVIEAAIEKAGAVNVLGTAQQSESVGISHYVPLRLDWLKALLHRGGVKSQEDAAYELAVRRLHVEVEPRTNLIRISYQDPRANFAASFVNTVVRCFLDKYIALSDSTAAMGFLTSQEDHYAEQFDNASEALSSFSVGSGIFNVEEQRQLLLKRRSELADAVATTKGAIAEKSAHIAELGNQLQTMRLTDKSAQVAKLLGEPAAKPAELGKDASKAFLDQDPPLLLVRVYQETVQDLVKMRADLAGLYKLAAQQEADVNDIIQKLNQLSVNEARFESLRRKVDVAKKSSELFASKTVQQQISAALDAQRFTRLRVAQAADIPLSPVTPKAKFFAAGGLLFALLASGLASLFFVFRQARMDPPRQQLRREADWSDSIFRIGTRR